MAWVAVDKDGSEWIFECCPRRLVTDQWGTVFLDDPQMTIELPKGSIKKLIDRDMSWEDNAVELKIM